MEIRLLKDNEVQWAVDTANEIYNFCVAPYVASPMEKEQFHEYVNVNHFLEERSKNQLFLWGIFEEGQMVAVSAIQTSGHISMLYVKPFFQRRGFATLMLNTMRMFALSTLHLNRVTINVTPISTVPFFLKRGFVQIHGTQNMGGFLPLEFALIGPDGSFRTMVPGNYATPYYGTEVLKKKETGVTYQTRTVDTKIVVGTIVIVLVLLFGIGITFALDHIAVNRSFAMILPFLKI